MSEELKVLADMLQLIDDGVLVRATQSNMNQGWAMKCLPLVMTLQKARSLVDAPSTGSAGEREAGEREVMPHVGAHLSAEAVRSGQREAGSPVSPAPEQNAATAASSLSAEDSVTLSAESSGARSLRHQSLQEIMDDHASLAAKLERAEAARHSAVRESLWVIETSRFSVPSDPNYPKRHFWTGNGWDYRALQAARYPDKRVAEAIREQQKMYPLQDYPVCEHLWV